MASGAVTLTKLRKVRDTPLYERAAAVENIVACSMDQVWNVHRGTGSKEKFTGCAESIRRLCRV